jgi:hypothetical protein
MAVVHYTSHLLTIGKHEWRIIVVDFWLSRKGDRCTDYQWRRLGSTAWNDARDWHGYNHNDTYDGLPKTLQVLYDREKRAVHEALGKPLQLELTDTQLILI